MKTKDQNSYYKLVLIGISILAVTHIFSQSIRSLGLDSIEYSVELWSSANSASRSAFWIQHNNYDIISDAPISNSTLISLSKPLNKAAALFDYGFKTSYLNQLTTQGVRNRFQEFYLEGKLGFTNLIIGANQQHIGPQDTELSSGGFLFSDNFKPIPQIHAGIFDYTAIPFTYGLIDLKGGIVHGWFQNSSNSKNVLLHHKYIALRIGNSLGHSIAYGFDHAAQWGGELPGYGIQPVNWTNYKIVFFAGHGGEDATTSDQINRLGNHLVSQHLQYQGKIGNFNLNAYWQTINEDSPIRLPWLAINWKDGLWGMTIENKKLPIIQKIAYEFIQTLDQSGPWHDKDGIVFGGSDSYFVGAYPMGWSYAGRTLTNPTVLSPSYNPWNYTSIYYNDLRTHHWGLLGSTKGFNYKLFATFMTYYPNLQLPKSSNQAFMIEIDKQISELGIGIKIAYDRGEILENNFGVMFSLKKSGILKW